MARDGAPVTVFINYRKAEASGWARALYDRLVERFGPDNVFLDQESIEGGARWTQDIRARSGGCTALIALIGPHWAETISKRAEIGEDDYVREEITAALERGSGVQEVIPVLIDGAPIPRKDDIRYLGSVQPLLNRQQVELRPTHWDADVQVLIEVLERSGGTAAEAAPTPASAAAGASPDAGEPARVAAPDAAHFEELARLMLEEESVVVPFLGPGANSCDRTERWEDTDSSYLPDSDELAAYLALKLGAQAAAGSLAEISQTVSVAKGPGDLYTALRRALPSSYPPCSVHRFLAGFPAATHEAGAPDRYQLIVTTNYDDALERAFDEAEEPYDVAVYIARGRDKGHFVHIPRDGEPRLIAEPNHYTGFPIDAMGHMSRTVIMKIHGAVDRPQGPYSWRDNYVITEDDYIDYMSVGEIESIVPQQLLGKLRDYSHFLFLGHEMHDWNLRVFLIRIFGERPLPNTSWAVQRQPTKLDERFWQRTGVELMAAPLEEYVRTLGEQLKRTAGAETAPG